MDDLTKALAKSLYNVLYDLHPVYGSTAGPYGGIGGQAMTQWCHVKDPYNETHETMMYKAHGALRDAIEQGRLEGLEILEENNARLNE